VLFLPRSFVTLAALVLAVANDYQVCDGPGVHGRIQAVDALERIEDRTSFLFQSEVQIVFYVDCSFAITSFSVMYL